MFNAGVKEPNSVPHSLQRSPCEASSVVSQSKSAMSKGTLFLLKATIFIAAPLLHSCVTSFGWNSLTSDLMNVQVLIMKDKYILNFSL